MKKLFSVLISIYLIQAILGACFNTNASGVSDCEKEKTNNEYCCYVEYRTDLDANYKKACVRVKNDDIKDGKFEETIGTIEGGNYTASGWTSEEMAIFLNYSSIWEFNCKGNFVSNTAILISLIFIIFLI